MLTFVAGICVGLLIPWLSVYIFRVPIAVKQHAQKISTEDTWRIPYDQIDVIVPLKVLGRGSVGIVVRGRWRGTDVALKFSDDQRRRASMGDLERLRNMTTMRVKRQGMDDVSEVSTSSSNVDEEWHALDPGCLAPVCTGSTSTPRKTVLLADIFPEFAYSGLDEQHRKSIGSSVTSNASTKTCASDVIHSMRLRHPKIVTVMGCVDEPDCDSILVLELMHLGSLHDMIHNTTISIDPCVLVSILKDVASSMTYLHLSGVSHGKLKSSNVLVDAGFQAKVTDIGMPPRVHDFWTAPEVINATESPGPASDVFAFGITMCEMLSRASPYDGEDPVDVMRQIADVTKIPPKRPSLPNGTPEVFVDLVRRCTVNDSESRPSFETVGMVLKQLNAPNIASSMMAASEDRRRSQKLINAMLPPRVAKSLKEGVPVEPEYYDCVTVFFSDIVNFTEMSNAMSPGDVMGMLDRLYSVFDDLTVRHGLFKVETIGDAYMVVGNLVSGTDWPQPDHASRIADFALAAVAAAQTVRVREGCDDVVHIRAGFHSGPVVASVAGRVTPRYCLFGDTVNMASRMESTSQPDKIGLSAYAASLLCDRLDLVDRLQPRGMIDIKGKGRMETFWLKTINV